MNSFVELLDDLLIKINSSVNEKIFGINYLENIKFQLIEQLISIDQVIFYPISHGIDQAKVSQKDIVYLYR